MRLLSIVLLTLVSLTTPAVAQGLFSPVANVNDSVITRYELDQRISLLSTLGARGDLREQAIEGLISDRLRVSEAAGSGIVPTEEAVQTAMQQFAERNGRSLDQVLGLLASNGVAQESLRDLVTANLVWQSLVRQRFGAATSVSEAEIDAALSATGETTNLQVLVTEIVLPLIEGQENEIRQLAQDITQIRSQEEFEAAARQFSVAQSRADSGRLDWISLSNLPPALRPVLLPLGVGEVSAPLELPNAIALFQMRGLSETTPTSSSIVSVEYAVATAPASTQTNAIFAEAADKALRCDDLYGLTQDANGVSVEIETRPPNDVPRQTALWLARLDAGETLVEQTTRDELVSAHLVMLCNRTSAANADASRADVRTRLLNEKLSARAISLLDGLRATARIALQ